MIRMIFSGTAKLQPVVAARRRVSATANGFVAKPLRRGMAPFVFLHCMRLCTGATATPLAASFAFSTGLRTSTVDDDLATQTFDAIRSVQAVKGEVDVFPKGLGENQDVKKILEMANRTSSRREVVHTNFLTPPVLKESMQALEKVADIRMVAQGGYPEAERCRLSVGHPDVFASNPDIVSAMSVSGNFEFSPCSHGDFLGAILGTGIVREKLGDIILQGESGAHIIVVPELVDFLASSLDKVGNVSVTCERIPLHALEYQPPRTKILKTVEASLRLDAIASAGFKISRSKMANYISAGDVRVNFSTVTKSNTTLRTGDLVSVSGQGRLKIGEINSTRKGKYAVEIIRFL